LSLPSEVREKILLHLIGDNLIHVKHLNYDDLAKAKGISWDNLFKADPKIAKEGAFRHAICVAAQSEQDVYDETVSGNAMVPEDESPDYFVASCMRLHEGCSMSEGGSKRLLPEEYEALTLDLRVLGACRQLYEEANHLLWATNTFSFDDANSLNRFLGSLNPAQKRNMSGMHISAKLDHWGSGRWDQAWSVALKMPYINMLRGVQNLHLCFEQCYASVRVPQTFAASYKLCKTSLDDHIKPFLRLRALDVKNITVVLCDNIGILDQEDQALFRWDRTAKNQYASDIRVQLLATNGAELVSKDAELANTAREIAMMNNAELNAIIAKSRVESMRDSVNQWTAYTKDEEEQAEMNLAKAAKITGTSKKAFKKVAKLQDEAHKKKEKAEMYRKQLGNLSKHLTEFQGKAVEAVAKHKRAKARVSARKAKSGVQTGDDTLEPSTEDHRMERPSSVGGEDEDDDEEPPWSLSYLRRELNEEEEVTLDDEKKIEDDDEGEQPQPRHMTDMDDEAGDTDEDDEMDDDFSSFFSPDPHSPTPHSKH